MYGFEAMTFNIHGGYLEAIVRGYRSGLLTAADYNNLCQCETLDDIKMHLSATEYGPYLQNGKQLLQTLRVSSMLFSIQLLFLRSVGSMFYLVKIGGILSLT